MTVQAIGDTLLPFLAMMERASGLRQGWEPIIVLCKMCISLLHEVIYSINIEIHIWATTASAPESSLRSST